MSTSNTAIEWADATWSPTIGCTKVSAGCEQCYAIKTAYRNAHFPQTRDLYAGLTTKHTDGSLNWTGKVRTIEQRLNDPIGWKKPKRIFVDSMSDLFHEDVDNFFIGRVLAVMIMAPQHTYQVLTKRPERMQRFMTNLYQAAGEVGLIQSQVPNPIPNLWLGVSAENQATADERIPLLLQTPAARRFVSAEPLLGPINLGRAMVADQKYMSGPVHAINWVISGGESGGPPERRLVWKCMPNLCQGLPGWGCAGTKCTADCGDCQGTGWSPQPEPLEWVRSIRDQCFSAGVPFFWKQWGGPTHGAGGRQLDGETWEQFPSKHPDALGGVRNPR